MRGNEKEVLDLKFLKMVITNTVKFSFFMMKGGSDCATYTPELIGNKGETPPFTLVRNC